MVIKILPIFAENYLFPVGLVNNQGFKPTELKMIEVIIEENVETLTLVSYCKCRGGASTGHSSNTTLHSLHSFSKVQEALELLVSGKRNTLMDCPN